MDQIKIGGLLRNFEGKDLTQEQLSEKFSVSKNSFALKPEVTCSIWMCNRDG